jgi:hypothetical protein
LSLRASHIVILIDFSALNWDITTFYHQYPALPFFHLSKPATPFLHFPSPSLGYVSPTKWKRMLGACTS